MAGRTPGLLKRVPYASSSFPVPAIGPITKAILLVREGRRSSMIQRAELMIYESSSLTKLFDRALGCKEFLHLFAGVSVRMES